jgi:hypothetical protein
MLSKKSENSNILPILQNSPNEKFSLEVLKTKTHFEIEAIRAECEKWCKYGMIMKEEKNGIVYYYYENFGFKF